MASPSRPRVIDDLRDFNVLDRGCDAVKVGHLLTKLVGEELTRRLFRIPDVEVVRPSGGLVQCEELEAKAWHAFERRPSIVGNTDHSRAVERILVLERDVDTNHGSSCGLSTHFYALAAGSPQVGRTDVEASLAGYCCLEQANATSRPKLAAAQQLYEEIVGGAGCVCGHCTADSFGAKAIHKLIDA